MRRSVMFRFIPVFSLFMPLTLAAAERVPAPLPQGVFLHASVKSPASFLDALDASVSAAAKGTPYALPPGTIPVLAQLYLPLPTTGWNMDDPVDIVMLGEEEPDGVGLLAHVESLESVLKALEESGADLEKNEESGYWLVDMKGSRDVYLAEAAGGRALIADNPYTVGRILESLDGLTPDFWGDGDVVANVNLPEGWEKKAFGELRRTIREVPDGLDGNHAEFRVLKESGVNADMAAALTRLCAEYLPVVLDEAGRLENVAVDLRLDGDRVGLAVRPGFPDGAFASRLAEAAEKRTNPDSSMLRYVADDADGIGFAAPVAEMIPGLFPWLRAAAGAFRDEAFLEWREALPELVDEFEASGPGESVSAAYFDSGSRYNATWLRAGDAARLMASYPKAFNAVNAVLDKAVVNPAFRFSFSCESVRTADGVEYLKSVLTPESPEKIEELLVEMEKRSRPANRRAAESAVQAVRRALNHTQLIAAKDDVIVVVAGEAGEDELLKALSGVDSAEGGLIGAAGARTALSDLRHRQNAFFLVDFNAALLHVAAEAAAPAIAPSVPVAALLDKLNSIFSEPSAAGEMIGVGFGAAGGGLVLDMSIPLRSVNVVIRNYERIRSALTEDDWEGGEDEDDEDDAREYDDGDEGPMEEDPEFDGPVGAS